MTLGRDPLVLCVLLTTLLAAQLLRHQVCAASLRQLQKSTRRIKALANNVTIWYDSDDSGTFEEELPPRTVLARCGYDLNRRKLRVQLNHTQPNASLCLFWAEPKKVERVIDELATGARACRLACGPGSPCKLAKSARGAAGENEPTFYRVCVVATNLNEVAANMTIKIANPASVAASMTGIYVLVGFIGGMCLCGLACMVFGH